jgi:hypothetical protein
MEYNKRYSENINKYFRYNSVVGTTRLFDT